MSASEPAEASFAARRALGVAGALLYLAPVALAPGLRRARASGALASIGFAALALLAASLPAQRSLDAHVRAVADGLDRGPATRAGARSRRSSAAIRDALDEAGVARAAIESLAENFSDGVVAPLFWIALGGLAGGALYKAVNTADSMIGHKDERYAPSAGRRRGSTISSICRPRGSPRCGSFWPRR